MSIHYRLKDNYLFIVGHTYPHRDAIRNLGAFFDKNEKAWKVLHNSQALAAIDTFCRNLGGGPLVVSETSQTPGSPALMKSQVIKPRSEAMPSTPMVVDKEGYTPSELMALVQISLSQAFPRAIWVIGEINNLNLRGSVLYFSLCEAKNEQNKAGTVSVAATMWSQAYQTLCRKIKLQDFFADGIRVRILCQVGLYKDRGAVSLNVLDVDPSFTKGALALAREQLLKELRTQGLDTKNKQLQMPAFPLRIGLISADQSRAKSDFLDQLASYGFPGTVVFRDARMQGERIVEEVCAALAAMVEDAVDVIVLTRGGGSAADLRWFDHKDLAYAIALSPIPIIAAIGHHEDTCVAEVICAHREKTPTAAADYVIARLVQTGDRINRISEGLITLAQRRLDSEQKFLQKTKEQLILAGLYNLERRKETVFRLTLRIQEAVQHQIHLKQNLVLRYAQKINDASTQVFVYTEQQIMRLHAALQRNDPMPWLEQGWTQIFNAKKEQIRSVDQLSCGEVIHGRLKDGTFRASLEEKNKINAKEDLI